MKVVRYSLFWLIFIFGTIYSLFVSIPVIYGWLQNERGAFYTALIIALCLGGLFWRKATTIVFSIGIVCMFYSVFHYYEAVVAFFERLRYWNFIWLLLALPFCFPKVWQAFATFNHSLHFNEEEQMRQRFLKKKDALGFLFSLKKLDVKNYMETELNYLIRLKGPIDATIEQRGWIGVMVLLQIYDDTFFSSLEKEYVKLSLKQITTEQYIAAIFNHAEQYAIEKYQLKCLHIYIQSEHQWLQNFSFEIAREERVSPFVAYVQQLSSHDVQKLFEQRYEELTQHAGEVQIGYAFAKKFLLVQLLKQFFVHQKDLFEQLEQQLFRTEISALQFAQLIDKAINDVSLIRQVDPIIDKMEWLKQHPLAQQLVIQPLRQAVTK